MKIRALRAMVFLILPAALLLLAAVHSLPAQEQPAEARKHYASAKEFLKKGERDKAIAELQEAIRLAPEFVEAHHDYISQRTGFRTDPDKAAALVKEYEERLKERAGSATMHYLLGRAYASAGRNHDGVAQYRKSLELNAGYSWALMELGSEALKDDNRVQATEYFEQARLKAGENAPLLLRLAGRLSSVRAYESALAEARRALQIDPTQYEVYPILWKAQLGLSSASEEAQAEVIRNIAVLETEYPDDPRVLDAVMQGYRSFFDDEAAAAVRKRILALDPQYFARQAGAPRFMIVTAEGNRLEFSGPEVTRALDAAKLTDPREQIEVYRQIAEETRDENLRIYFLNPRLFNAYLKADDLESAERLAEQMEKVVDPILAARSSQGLAEAYLAKGTGLDRAQSYADKAVEAFRRELGRLESSESPGREILQAKRLLAASLHVQGRILIAKDRTEAAVPSLQESLQLLEAESVALDLGLAYEKLGSMNEAVEMLAMAVSFEGPRKQEARTALDRIYGDREKTVPVAILLEEAAAKRKKSAAESGSGERPVETSILDGKEAPDFKLASVKGDTTRLSGLRGNVVLLNFWATW